MILSSLKIVYIFAVCQSTGTYVTLNDVNSSVSDTDKQSAHSFNTKGCILSGPGNLLMIWSVNILKIIF